MHVHTNAISPNAQLDALSSAQRAEGKREAARVRKKLSEIASGLAGEAESGEACVVSLQGRQEAHEEPNRQDQQGSGKKEKERPEVEGEDNSISDWA